jgi:hypothetical protein
MNEKDQYVLDKLERQLELTTSKKEIEAIEDQIAELK